MNLKPCRIVLVLAGLACAVHCTKSEVSPPSPPSVATTASAPSPTATAPATIGSTKKPPTPASHPLVAAARTQIGKTLRYDPTYIRLPYPEGDVSITNGVCTDVVIRALRTAWHIDLQQLVHEDMKKSFAQYPQQWGLRVPDANIDHRRVPNLRRYFERQGYTLPVTRQPDDFLPGDLVTCMVGGKLPHIMIVSDQKNTQGCPLVIHNIGQGTKEEDCLLVYPLTGHYRIPAKP